MEPGESRDGMAENSAEGRSKRAAAWGVGCGILAVAAAAALVWAGIRLWPIDEQAYARVHYGMSKAEVLGILGNPGRRYVKSADEPRLRQHIGCSPGGRYATDEIPAYPPAEVLSAAAELWRWSRLIDQRIGVVFDDRGEVIFKWLDY